MTDTDQTREQLIEEVTTLRARVAELEGRLPKEFVRILIIKLRTHSTTIKLYEHLLRERGDQDPEKRDRYYAVIRHEIKQFEMALEKTNYWMHLQTEREPKVRLEAVDLNATVESAAADMQMLAESSKVTLTFAPQPDLPPAQSNGWSLGSYVLHMILINAVTYTPEGGKVTITTGTQDTDNQKWGGFMICDTGPGIPPDELPHVFEPYFRGKVGLHFQNTGLGLAIAKQSVELLQGRIEIASSGVPGEGTTVSVWLPIAASDDGSERPTI